MQRWDDLTEIEALGEGEEEPWEEEKEEGGGGLGAIPLLQALVCVLALAGILYLRHTGHPAYGQLVERYRQEAAQEWRLPGREEAATPTPAPTPGPSPSEAPAALPDRQVQKL